MRKLGLVLSILAALGLSLPWVSFVYKAHAENVVGPPNNIFCNKVAPSAILSAGTAQLVAGVSGQIINICGYVLSGAAAGTVQLEFGTGASCTTPTVLSPVFTTASAADLQDHSNNAWASSAPGASLCAVVTGTSSVSIVAYYSQF
jgi:hypothetical protein